MEIIEKFIEGKVNEQLCEDALVVTDDYIAVIDGVTSRDNYTVNGKRPGKIASEMLVEILSTIPADLDITEIIALYNQKIQDFYANSGFPGKPFIEGPQAVMAVFSRVKQTIWLIGDCQVMVNGYKIWNEKKTDRVLANLRALLANIDLVNSGMSEAEYFAEADKTRQYITPWIKSSRAFANKEFKDYAYSVLNGESIPARLITTIKFANFPLISVKPLYSDDFHSINLLDYNSSADRENCVNGESNISSASSINSVDSSNSANSANTTRTSDSCSYKDGFEIILASDGYLDLKPSLELSEKRLNEIYAQDFYAINAYPQTKACVPGNNGLDDRTFIRFRI